MEAAQEAAAELEESIKKLVDQHDTAVEVNNWAAFFGVKGRMKKVEKKFCFYSLVNALSTQYK